MNLDLGSSSQIRVKFDGKEEVCRKPKTKEMMEMEAKMKSGDGVLANQVLVDFLKSLGLSEEFVMNLETEGLEKLCEALMPSKKK